ncbi:TonB-dependent receptor [Chitinophaga sp. YIM B06452]|uniref:SusC/RagA family TonB-linked outer membrane protein n=1 Tax=Chitinophaga sp. YIM B06452 TaxID=3082158 RepID=UPI0031FED2BC
MELFKRSLLLRFLAACFGVICLSSLTLRAQDLPISGKVTSATDGSPLMGVSIQVQGTSKGIGTDVNGAFKISAPAGAVLRFSFIGYLPQEIKITKAATLDVKLQEDVQKLNETVVVGYGTRKKATLTGAVATIDMSEKEGQPITNVSNALHGTPGLFVNLSNSQPGIDRSTIRIRGVGTLNNNNPLVLVDGIEYSMDELNPNDIESISVLKDAAAAIYGSRGANGVILVTTKKGKGAAKVNYSYYRGFHKATYLPDAINDPIAYMRTKNQALKNENKAVEYSDAEIAEYEQGMLTDNITYPKSDWYKIAIDNGSIQKHDLSVAASTDQYQYRLSLGFLDRDGIQFGPTNHAKNYSLGLNASMNVTKKLKAGITLDGYYRNYTQPTYNTFWQAMSRTLPILTDTLADGRYGNSWLKTAGRNNWEHPRLFAYGAITTKLVQRFLATVNAEYKLPFDITYNIKFGVDKYDGLLSTNTPRLQTFNPKTGAPTNWNSPATAPRFAKTDENDISLHFYNTLDWKKTFGSKHNVSAMIGSSYDNFDKDQFNAAMTGYLDNGEATLTALDAGLTFNAISGNTTRDVIMSYFGRANYDYDDKYLFEFTFRADGSSRFAPDNRWGYFPAASAGWRIDREEFWNVKFIDQLKLRASVGQLGNQAVELYSYAPTVATGQDYSFGGTLQQGNAKTQDTDPGIHWETTTTYNGGIDMNMWKNRIALTVDVYKKRTDGILRPVNLPAQVGNLTGPQRNIGTVDNTGYEITLQYRNNIREVNYGVWGNVSYNKNKVVDLDGEIIYSGATITKKGYPLNSYYILQADGYYQNADEITRGPKQGTDTRPGFIRYKDVKQDGIINGDDRVIMNASSIMPKYTFGFGFNVDWKGISLTTAWQGVAGVKVYPRANLAYPFVNGANATWEWTRDTWTPENPNARLPLLTTGGTGNFTNLSDFWLRNGDYLRMKNIQLAYALPASLLQKVKISRVSVYVNAENLLTISKYKDLDPESLLNRNDLYTYPMLKTFTGGINVTF